MKKIHLILSLFMATSFILSCDKNDDDIDEQLVGTWNVTKVEGQQFNNGSPGIKLQDDNPTGYIKFESNGRGEQNYSFTLFGTTYPQNSPFRWNASSSTINIKRQNDTDLVWERLVKQNNKQVASYDIEMSANSYIKYTLTIEK